MTFDIQKKKLNTEDQDLRISLEKEEKPCLHYQKRWHLRELIRTWEDKGTGTELVTEDQKHKQH